jgi:prevent-host-death family protein
MRSIGVRELRQRASEFLRAVQGGETVEVTDRGRPIALLIPVPSGSGLQRLEAEGRLTEADGDLLELGEPLPAERGVELPSRLLTAARADER